MFLAVCACACHALSQDEKAGDLVLSTSLGRLAIKLRPDLSPESIEYIKKVTRAPISTQASCKFYRLEAVPPPGVVDPDGNPGPPYALLQGSLGAAGVPPIVSAPKTKAIEQPMIETGMVAWAGGGLGPDFFIAFAPHHEWATGHNIWGEVRDMAALEEIRKQPIMTETWGTVKVSSMQEKVPFVVSISEVSPIKTTEEKTPLMKRSALHTPDAAGKAECNSPISCLYQAYFGSDNEIANKKKESSLKGKVSCSSPAACLYEAYFAGGFSSAAGGGFAVVFLVVVGAVVGWSNTNRNPYKEPKHFAI